MISSTVAEWVDAHTRNWTNEQKRLVQDWPIEEWSAMRDLSREFGQAKDVPLPERQRRELVVLRHMAGLPRTEDQGTSYSPAYSKQRHLEALRADREKHPDKYNLPVSSFS